MTLTLYNTLTRRKEPFRPIDAKNVRMYVCGPTVYDFAHIGNARPVIVFDVLFRLLRHIYGAEHVTYARNITDVEDKINARAAEEGIPIGELTERTTRQFHEDIRALGILTPDDVNKPGEPPVFIEPRATEYIRRSDNKLDMVRLIESLVHRGNAYVADDHVLFDVSSMPDYGRLSNRSLEEMEAGARVEVAPYKKGPMDFVLWKPSKPGEPSWPSPAGIAAPGRPGWHIECSAMAGALLGEVFDIHGGGIDLVFPHHENEIAQSRCAHGTPVMANVWMHNGFLQVEGEKMSKSLGNFVTIRELLHEAPGEAVRLTMLKTHYRQPINWTRAHLEESEEELSAWATRIELENAHTSGYTRQLAGKLSIPSEGVAEALRDDLNTPAAITALRALYKQSDNSPAATAELLESCEFLGLLRHDQLGSHDRGASGMGAANVVKHYDAVQRLRIAVANGLWDERDKLVALIESDGTQVTIDASGSVLLGAGSQKDEVEERIKARNAARKAKDFKESDRIRDELAAMGIQLKDAKDPATGEIVTTWEVKR